MPLPSSATGFVVAVDAGRIGRASMLLGAGRERLDSAIDYGAGILLQASVGDQVTSGQPLAQLHIGRTARLDEARQLAATAFTIGDGPPAALPRVLGVVA
jgi:thymidine phosphorylase